MFFSLRQILWKMSSNVVLNRIKNNANNTENVIKNMKSEMTILRNELIARTVRELEAENKRLRDEIEATKRKLIQLETNRGVKQVPLPGQKKLQCSKTDNDKTPTKPESVPQIKIETAAAPEVKSSNKKEKVPKNAEKVDKPKKAPAPAAPEAPIDVGRLDMRIGLIKEVQKHPDADSLYVSKIDCGEPQLRTVVSGLVKFVPREELEGRLVVLMCNLKPAKMRGVTSEAMVMCASTPEKVEVLSPPKGAQPGDLVHCEGYERNPDAQLNPKKKIFETCAPDLKTNASLTVCYKDKPLLVPGKGTIVAQTLAGVQVK
ncbi:aminoacyl tRNA synthase complex-interacting multifunctional protein 1 [Chrysoperla carnea]|uniref:aminoacyl tRNA synthase complex-interacting multifunctional protein 1 n=1 Tax=Chrysoperla carnea TaxID=189513 RepID=UPI001D070882|nr:aminoacyl tRNA synthase complex-interacting multifunctional protein 1 [Chrysoperla carnea]